MCPPQQRRRGGAGALQELADVGPRAPFQPRIVIAARELDDATERFARKIGADAVLRRPISQREWVNVVSDLARQERPASAPVHHAG